MSTPDDTPSASTPPKPRAAGRSFRYLCPRCQAELTAVMAEAQSAKACPQCGQPAVVPRAPVGINTGAGTNRLPVAIAVGDAPKPPAVPLTAPASVPPPPVGVVSPPPPTPPPPPRLPAASVPWVAPFSAGAVLGLLLGVVGFLAFAGFRHGRGVGDTDQLQAQLTFVQTQWRLAEISRDRITKDYLITLEIYKTNQKSGLNVADMVTATERAIAAEKGKIGKAADEIARALSPLVARFKADATLLDQPLAAAMATGGGQGPEVLTEVKTILQQAPAESDRWPAYLHDAVAKKLAPSP